MSTDEIEAIVKDVIEFVDDELFATTQGEKTDLANFLRERLAALPQEPQPENKTEYCKHDWSYPPDTCPVCGLPTPLKMPTSYQERYPRPSDQEPQP